MIVYTILWFSYMIFVGWFTIGCIVSVLFGDMVTKVNPPKRNYSTGPDDLKEIMTWPYVFYNICKYWRRHGKT